MQTESNQLKVFNNFALGRQLTVEYYECNPKILADCKLLEEIFIRSAKDSGATVISSNFHEFSPQGVSGVVIISESHFTVHVWPEHEYAAVDIFTCGESINFNVAIESLKARLMAGHAIVSSVMNRGIVNNNGIERLVPICEDQNSRYALSWKTRFESTGALGISVSIDIYDLLGGRSFQLEDVRKFAGKLAAETGIFSDAYKISVDFCEKNNLVCLRINEDASGLSGRFFLNEHNGYFDIFSKGYFEPRRIAEYLLAQLDGSHYRMQVAIRQ